MVLTGSQALHILTHFILMTALSLSPLYKVTELRRDEVQSPVQKSSHFESEQAGCRADSHHACPGLTYGKDMGVQVQILPFSLIL